MIEADSDEVCFQLAQQLYLFYMFYLQDEKYLINLNTVGTKQSC